MIQVQTLYVFGGYGGGHTWFNDVWRSTNKGVDWTVLTSSAPWSARSAHTSVVDAYGNMFVMGGSNNGTNMFYNDVWVSLDSGRTWNILTTAASWSPRSGHASIADPQGYVYVMGGTYTSDYVHWVNYNDVYRSVDGGIHWILMQASAPWFGRQSLSSVLDINGYIYVRGGDPTNGNDVWRSRDGGINWFNMTMHAQWSARYQQTAVVTQQGYILVMGGRLSRRLYSYTSDVWQSACPANTYSSSNTLCLTCPLHASSTLGSSSCTCNSGYLSSYDSSNNLICTACPANTFATPDNTLCVPCSSGMTSSAGSSSCSCISGYQSANNGEVKRVDNSPSSITVPVWPATRYGPLSTLGSLTFTGTGMEMTNTKFQVGSIGSTRGFLNFTVEAWVKFSSFTNAMRGSVPQTLGAFQVSAKNASWAFGPDGNGHLAFFGFNGSSSYNWYQSSTTTIPLSTWTHICAQVTPNTIYMYINGVLVGSPKSVPFLETLGTGIIGVGQNYASRGGTGPSFQISDIRIVFNDLVYPLNGFTPPSSALTAILSPQGNTILLFQIVKVLNVCAPCGPGLYSVAPYNTTYLTCQSCPANTYAPGNASASCLSCPPNSFSVAGSSICTCYPGFIQRLSGSNLTCSQCSANTYYPSTTTYQLQNGNFYSSSAVAIPTYSYAIPQYWSSNYLNGRGIVIINSADTVWGGGGSGSGSPYYVGIHSVKNVSPNPVTLYQTVTIVPGITYTLSFYARSQPGVASSSPLLISFGASQIASFPLTTSWQQFSGTWTPSISTLVTDVLTFQQSSPCTGNCTVELINMVLSQTVTYCAPCPQNTTSSPGSTSCSCAGGFSQTGFGPTVTCQACTRGTYQPARNNSLYNFLRLNASRATVCAPCPENTYASSNLTSVCTACPAHSSSMIGSSTCKCNSGYAQSGSGSTLTCSKCPLNTFASSGDSVCTACPRNSSSLPGFPTCLCNGGYGPSGYGASLTCSRCPPGYFQPSQNLSFYGSMLAFDTLIPGKSPWGIYSAASWSSSTNTLTKLRGRSGKNAVTSGSFSQGKGTGNSASVPIDYISGSAASSVIWPSGSIPTSFTICSVTRYTDSMNAQRILTSTDNSWVHGHYAQTRGVASYGQWMTTNTNGTLTDWLVMCGKKSPRGITYSPLDNALYVADYAMNRVRRIALTSGVISTICGTGVSSYSGDGGFASSATLSRPWGVAVDSNPYRVALFISDSSNDVVRRIDGVSGVITSIAGVGTPDYSGDMGLAINAALSGNSGLFVDNDGMIYIADSDNHRIRKVITMPISPTPIPTSAPTPAGSPPPSPRPTPRSPTLPPTPKPSALPTAAPTPRPTSEPTGQPTSVPSRQPTSHPSKPSSQPTSQPSMQPSRQPTKCPTRIPSSQPTRQPISHPSFQPTSVPSSQPTNQPTRKPSRQPSRQPSSQPSSIPTSVPSYQPTARPSSQPSRKPTSQPSRRPSRQPTRQPSSRPSSKPSRQPTSKPTSQPSRRPTSQPSRQPSSHPSSQPSRHPTSHPTSQPISLPTSRPSHGETTQVSFAVKNTLVGINATTFNKHRKESERIYKQAMALSLKIGSTQLKESNINITGVSDNANPNIVVLTSSSSILSSFHLTSRLLSGSASGGVDISSQIIVVAQDLGFQDGNSAYSALATQVQTATSSTGSGSLAANLATVASTSTVMSTAFTTVTSKPAVVSAATIATLHSPRPTSMPTSQPSCGEGSFGNPGNCGPCSPGYYSHPGSSTCIPCPKGKYSSAFGSKQCSV